MIMTMKGIRIGHPEDILVPMVTGAKMQEGELYPRQQDHATAAVDVGMSMQTMRLDHDDEVEVRQEHVDHAYLLMVQSMRSSLCSAASWTRE